MGEYDLMIAVGAVGVVIGLFVALLVTTACDPERDSTRIARGRWLEQERNENNVYFLVIPPSREPQKVYHEHKHEHRHRHEHAIVHGGYVQVDHQHTHLHGLLGAAGERSGASYGERYRLANGGQSGGDRPSLPAPQDEWGFRPARLVDSSAWADGE